MSKIDIYGERNKRNPYQTEVGEEANETQSKYHVINIDGDKGLTLMDCIQLIKKVIDEVPEGEKVTLYVVKGVVEHTSFDWKLLWEYLGDTGRNYDIVYRGHIVDVAFLMAFDLEFITVYLSESNDAIGMLRHHGYKFEII